jgi:hypothetical protein
MWLFRFSFVLLLYLLMNIYTGFRLFCSLKLFFPSFRALAFWPIYIPLCYSLILVMLLRLDKVLILRQAGMYSLPFFGYFFLALIVLDALRLILRQLKIVLPVSNLPLLCTAIALGMTVLFMVYGTFHAKKIHTVNYEINLSKRAGGLLPQEGSLRIALISDTHIGVTVDRKWVTRIVDAVNRTEPDIVFIVGDIFDNDIDAVRDLAGIAEELRRFRAPLGVFASQGNHDVDRISWRGALRGEATAERIKEFLKDAGITLLLDEVVLVADSFYLVGRRDISPIGSRHIRKTAAELAEVLDKSRPIIFLDHQPVDFPGKDEAGADLILSGHTHKGQVFPGSIVTEKMFREAGAIHYGYWQGRNAQAVVTSGVGVWGPPMRIGTLSEVAVIDVKFGL